MKRLLLAASIAFALTPALAFAAPAPDRHDGGQRWSQPQSHRDGHDRRDARSHRPVHRHDDGRHPGWHKQAYRRGQRVPTVYLQPRYYVTDYRAYGLSVPPRGYRWVRPYQASNEYLLVQMATGLIAQVLGY